MTQQTFNCPETYSQAVVAYADFDAESLAISNEVEVTELNEANNNWYASWAQDEDKLIYACAGDCPEGQSIGHLPDVDRRSVPGQPSWLRFRGVSSGAP